MGFSGLGTTSEASDPADEKPAESAGPDGSGPSDGGVPLTLGDAYTWHDGDRTLGAVLLPGLVVAADRAVDPEEVVADTGSGPIVARGEVGPTGASGASGASGGHPVFLSESGELMSLPGGVILALDAGWDQSRIRAFFAANGIASSRVSQLDYLTNGFFVTTEPGFASLELANALAVQAGVELSSPNWWRAVVAA